MMNDNSARERPAESAAPAETPAEGAAPPEQATPWAAGGKAPDPAAALAAEIERLENEKADLTERLVRLAAEMDNLRKRTERDVQDARKYAVTKFAGDMLVVGDSLRRALDAVPTDRKDDEAVKALFEGVGMTGREMDRLLEKHGVTRINAIGEKFDPHRHQAMFEVEDVAPAGTIAQVVQEGYQIGDRVLRAALVGVSKGVPATKPPADESKSGADAAG
jgi:molecular chaperone GrpE